jgi:hypothetical protein
MLTYAAGTLSERLVACWQRAAAQAAGAQFTYFTGTKAQMLTPVKPQVLSLLALLVQKYEC